MHLTKVILLSFIALVCVTQLVSATVVYTFIGGEDCQPNQALPCDFDNGAYWSAAEVGATKKSELEILGNLPASPAAYTNPYSIVIPGQWSSQNITLKTSTTSGYYFTNITLQKLPQTRNTRDVEGSAAGPGMKILIKDTTLFQFRGYEIGDDYIHQLVFENTIVVATGTEGACTQNSYSLVNFKGTTFASLYCVFNMYLGDTFQVDASARLRVQSQNFIEAAASGQVINIYGKLELEYGWNLNSINVDSITLTGSNVSCDAPGDDGVSFNTVPIYIGKTPSDNGKITTITFSIFRENQISISNKNTVYITPYYFIGSRFIVDGESKLYIQPYAQSDGFAVAHQDNSDTVVKGNSTVYYDKLVKTTQTKKRSSLGASLFFNFTVYDGLLQFKDVKVESFATYFKTKHSSSVLTFNGNLTEYDHAAGNPYAFFEFAAGSKITFNGALVSEAALPGNGVHYEFGPFTYSKTPNFAITNSGSLKLKDSTFNGMNITIEDSVFSGYGNIEQSLTLKAKTSSPTLNLSNVGKTLAVGGLLKIPASSILAVSADPTTCAKVVAGTLDISSDITFQLNFIGQVPTENKTYIVAEYETFLGSIPASPNEELYQIEHDTVNKQIRVNFIYTPPPPVEPVTPTPTDIPTETPPPTNAPSTASSISLQFGLLLIMMFVALFV